MKSNATETNLNESRIAPNRITDALNQVPVFENEIEFEVSDPATAPIIPIQFVIEGMAARRLVTVISGVGGSGKSFFIQYLLQTRSNNLIRVNPGLGYYITGADASLNEVRLRAHKIIDSGYGGLSTIHPTRIDIDTLSSNMQFMTSLRNRLIRDGADSVVFDTLRDYYDGDSKEAQIANRTMVAFRRLAEEANVVVILITHNRKSTSERNEGKVEDVADSRIFTTKSDFVFSLKSEYKDDESSLVEVSNLKTRSSRPIAKFRFKVVDVNESVRFERTDELFSWETSLLENKRQKSDRDSKIVELHADGMSALSLAEMFKISPSYVHQILRKSKLSDV